MIFYGFYVTLCGLGVFICLKKEKMSFTQNADIFFATAFMVNTNISEAFYAELLVNFRLMPLLFFLTS